jgi:predicted PP-loop superfamily ATPase
MKPRHNHEQCTLNRIESSLEEILSRLNRIEQKENFMSKQLDDLTADVAQEVAVDQSAIVLINGIAAQIAAAGVDPAKLADLSNQLRASSAALAAAVQANTPVTAPPTGEPPVTT